MTRPPPITAYIGLGSNLADPVAQLDQARLSLAQTPGITELAYSGLFRSPPMGPPDQPDYVNAVMAIETELAPLMLLQVLQAIENQQGRIRQQRWGARTLDLDLLLYGQQEIRLPELIVPHPGLTERAFVLYPLAEIAPNLTIPGKGSLAALVADCARNGLEKIR